MTFREYLAARRKTYDRAGDFVLEALESPALADAGSWPELENLLTSKYNGFEAVEAAKTVWQAYLDAEARPKKASV